MTPRALKRLARREPIRAVIVSDGCRDYVVELHTDSSSGLLTNWRGKRKRFASLAQAKHAVRHASNIELAVRVAADEAAAGLTQPTTAFSHLVLATKANTA